MKLLPLMVEVVLGITAPEASIDVPALIVPASMAAAMSVRSTLAKATAPLTLSMPAPCCNRLAPGMGCAVYCRMALTSGGVSPGLACNIRATVPATTGAEIEVPLIIIWVSRKVSVMPVAVTSWLK